MCDHGPHLGRVPKGLNHPDFFDENPLDNVADREGIVCEIVRGVFAEALKLSPKRVPGDASLIELSASIPIHHQDMLELTLHGTRSVVQSCAEAFFGEPRHLLLTSEFEDAWGEVANLIAGVMIQRLAPTARLDVPIVVNRRLNPQKQPIVGQCWLDVSFVLGEEGTFRVASYREPSRKV